MTEKEVRMVTELPRQDWSPFSLPQAPATATGAPVCQMGTVLGAGAGDAGRRSPALSEFIPTERKGKRHKYIR